MRRTFIAGNWKMHTTRAGALELAKALRARVGDNTAVDIAVFPPFVYLPAVVDALRGSRIVVGAQNLHPEPKGAYTGEVSGPMILDVGATHVLIGHSERRQFFGETDGSVNAKLKAALQLGLKPIVCVGETLQQRQAGETQKVVGTQLAGALQGVSPDRAAGVVLAYEPVWAIGTGVTATPAQAQEVHAFIRARLADALGQAIADGIRIQYGGSVKAGNAAELLAQPDLDGALVGGACLDAESFIGIIQFKEA